MLLIAATVLSISSAQATNECPTIPERRAAYEGAIPVGGTYLPNRADEQSQAQRRSGEVVRDLWANLRDERSLRWKERVAAVANALWREAAAVADAGAKIELCPEGCEAAAEWMRRVPEWLVPDAGGLMLTKTAEGAGGFVARFGRGALSWSLRCQEGEPEGYTECVAALRNGDRLVATYWPDSSNELTQSLRVRCGTFELQSGEDGKWVSRRSVRVGTHLTEIPFSGQVWPQASKASSVLAGSYGPEKAWDGDAATAWAEGAPGAGVGQWIELRWPGPRRIGTVGVFPGLGKSRALFRANARIKRAKVSFSDGHEIELAFDDVPALQYRPTSEPSPWKEPWDAPVTSMRLEILEVYPGEKYEDTCVAEIMLFGPM
jgi:hypothetical protein